MAWVESHTVLSRHRKMKELARSLRLKPVYVMGHLHALWHDALEQQEDGNLTKWSDDLIAESSQFDGDAPKYVSLLQEHGWLDGRLIHDWLDYAGRYLESKYRTSDPERLVGIWMLHGKVYLKTDLRQTKVSPPNQTLPTLPTKPITPAAGAARSSRFLKPTSEEVTSYARSIGFKLDGEAFVAHYESKGWMIGKSPMKDWRSAVVTWKKSASPSAMILPPKPPPPQEKKLSEADRLYGIEALGKIKKTLMVKEISK